MRQKYVCKFLDVKEADLFIEDEHRQGALTKKVNTKNLGLYLGEDLVGVLQVGPSRTDAMRAKYTAEIYRLAFKRGVRVPGGASKLIKNYIRLCNPTDFFTYQDTTGENTLVYHHSGMTLVQDGLKRKKEYLVAPNKTLATATRKESLGMGYATRYGPDRILGTKLGEVFREDGSRKTNKEIFIEDLGWHVEVTTGDSVWEWTNPNITFYTYKITATDSDKYYYGVSHVKKANATVEECLNDGYYGSGGGIKGKFVHWREKHSEYLRKEVIDLFDRRAAAYIAEQNLVGDHYKTDPLCLNSVVGGKLQPHSVSVMKYAECSIHGTTKHNGSKCAKCSAQTSRTVEQCETHGETAFVGGRCARCTSLGSKTIRECEVHGLTKFQGDQCYKCFSTSVVLNCAIHGEEKHYGGRCMRCVNEKIVSEKECAIHGLVKHIGDRCYPCVSGEAVTMKVCPEHGETKHRGEKCFKCRDSSLVPTLKTCSTHGESKHFGDTCMKCSHAKNVVMKQCAIHGESKHRGDSCFKCNAAKRKKRNS